LDNVSILVLLEVAFSLLVFYNEPKHNPLPHFFQRLL
jgi:hypothetical protein